MYVGVCDDDRNSLIEVTQLIKAQEVLTPIKIITMSTLAELLEVQKKLDILFLDIEIGQENSLDFLNQFHNNIQVPTIVLISSHSCYVTRSYQVSVFQFLLKPLQLNLFTQVFADCYQRYIKLQQWCALKDEQGEVWQVPLYKIVCVKSEQRRIVYYDKERNRYYGAASSLSAVLQELQAFGFCQIAKGCLINLAYVTAIEDTAVTVCVDQQSGTISISKKYLQKARIQYLRYCADLEGI